MAITAVFIFAIAIAIALLRIALIPPTFAQIRVIAIGRLRNCTTADSAVDVSVVHIPAILGVIGILRIRATQRRHILQCGQRERKGRRKRRQRAHRTAAERRRQRICRRC